MSDLVHLLAEALFAIYSRAGHEVTYVTDRGETRNYWANRFRQALQRAVENDTVVEFVERLVTQEEPSRGFGYLHAAGRLDLSVEALVVDRSLPFHALFSEEAVAASRRRLREYGYLLDLGVETDDQPQGVAASTPSQEASASQAFELDLKMRVDADGRVTLHVVR